MLRSKLTAKKSRLGTLLVHRNLINRQQLYEALDIQEQQGKKIGEILIEKGWVTEKQLNQVLHKQSRYRLIAAFSAILLGPIQPVLAASNKPLPIISQRQNSDTPFINELSISPSGYEQILETVRETLNHDAHQAASSTIEALAYALLPGSNILDAKVEVQGVVYEDGPQLTLNHDGSLNLKLPTSIRQVAFRDIKTSEEQQDEHIGDLVIQNIEFGANHSITVKLKSE